MNNNYDFQPPLNELEELDNEPITERLRGIPVDDWHEADFDEETAALDVRIEDRSTSETPCDG